MDKASEFDLTDFLPYLLHQAAEVSSINFQKHYKTKYGLQRAEWRVLFHLGRYGEMTAKDICLRSRTHKTPVSRAIAALTVKRYLTKRTNELDLRSDILLLTAEGEKVYSDLRNQAQKFNTEFFSEMTGSDRTALKAMLRKIAKL